MQRQRPLLDVIRSTIVGIVTVNWNLWFGKPLKKGSEAWGEAFADALTKRTRLQSAGEFLTFLSVMTAGCVSLTWWGAIFVGAVVLLFFSDRGQHRLMADQYQRLGWWYVLTLSIGTSALNNLVFCTLAFVTGHLIRWVWFG